MEGVAFQAIILQYIGAEAYMKLQGHLFYLYVSEKQHPGQVFVCLFQGLAFAIP